MYRGVFSRLVKAVFAIAVVLSLFALTRGNASANSLTPGAVYVLTNASGGNAVQVFHRAADGSLSAAGSFSTGGLGSGISLGSQGAVVLSQDGRHLFAVNAGSNDISVFSVGPDGLKLQDRVASGGSGPISLTVFENLVYVLNASGSANITGLRFHNGTLSPISGSTRPLSAAAAGPAEVAFSPNGHVLVVTEKNTNKIDTYTVDDTGRAGPPSTFASNGAVPFGFAFNKRGFLIVSEAAANAVSSYAVSDTGGVSLISPSVKVGTALAPCWIAVTKDGRYAYSANAHSGSISGFRVSQDGTLSLVTANAITANPGGAPIDMILSHDSQYLYVLNTGTHAINAFKVQSDGTLITLDSTGGLPASAVGIAAW